MNSSHNFHPEGVLANVGWVRSLALQVAGHSVSSDDVAQETWLRVLHNPPPEGVSAHDWIAGTVHKVSVELARQSRRRKERETIAARTSQRERELETTRQVEVERDVIESVMALKEPLRQTVLSRYFEHMSPREIARRDGVPVSTVNTRLSTAYARLRQRLTERPDSAAGAFFCLTVGDALKATSTTVGSTAAVASKPALLAASFLTVVGLGLWSVRSEPSNGAAVAPLISMAPAAVSIETSELASVASLSQRVAEVAGQVSTPGASPATEQIMTLSGTANAPVPSYKQLSVRVLDYLGEPVSDAPIVVRTRGSSAFLSRLVRSASGPNGEAAVVDPTQAIGLRPAHDAQLELFVEGVGIATKPVLLHVSDLPSETLDIIITEPFGSIVLECVDGQGIALAEEVEVIDLGHSDPGAFRRRATIVPAGKTERLFPVAVGRSPSALASARAGYATAYTTLTGPTEHRGTVHHRIEFVQPCSTVAFQLTPSDAAAIERHGHWAIEFQADGSEEIILEKRPWTEDGVHFVATLGRRSLAGQTGELTIRWAPQSVRSKKSDGSNSPIKMSQSITFPPVTERLDLGKITFEPARPRFSGQVVDAQGHPVPKASVALLEWKLEQGSTGWHSVTSQFIQTAKDGSFPCPAVPSVGRFALAARRGESLASLPWPWDPEAEEVELVLAPATTVTGRLVVPPGADPSSLRVRTVPSTPENDQVARALPGDDGSFSLRALTGEAVSLEVTSISNGTVLARLDDVPLGPSSGDPRLHPWDLSAELQLVVLRIEDEAGSPVDNALVRSQGQIFIGRGDTFPLIVQRTNSLVTVMASGYRTLEGRLDELPPVITLRPGYEVHLEIDAGPEAAALMDSLVVGLARTERVSSEDLSRLQGDAWTRAASDRISTARPSVNNGGINRLVAPGPGEYDLFFRRDLGGKLSEDLDVDLLPAELRAQRVIVKDIEGVQTFRFECP